MSSQCFEFMDREFVNILLVSSMIEDHLSLRSLISHSNWRLHHAFGREEAVALLKKRPIPVVICDSELSDGTWRDFWKEIGGLPAPPRLIVSSRVADNILWGEVLNLGAYDLLIKSFEASEVFRVGFLAWHSWCNEHGHGSKPPVVVDAPNMVQQVSRAAAQGQRQTTPSGNRCATNPLTAPILDSTLGCYVECKRLGAYDRTQSTDRGRPGSPGNGGVDSVPGPGR